MIREGNSKLIGYPKINRWQLFNLADDPNELNDLIAKEDLQDRVNDLRTKLINWLKQHHDSLVIQ